MATDKTYPSGLRRIGGGTAESTHSQYGIATPDSIEAALQQAIGKGDDALNGVENLKWNVKTVDSSASASGSMTGVAPNLTVNVSIPRGRPGLDGGHAMDASANRRGLTPLLRAMDAGEARIVVMGDSNSEGFFLQEWDQRWMNVLRDKLRARWNITGDQGRGYLPATYNTLGSTPPKPTLGGASGNTAPITSLGGLGLRSLWMKGDGTVTWPTLTFSATTPLRVLINRRPLHGSIEILVDGVVKATVPSGGTDAIIVQDITVTAGTHTVSARGQGGSTVQIAGIEHRTGQGVAVYDGALSGATARTFTDPSPGQALHWSEVQRINPHLLIVALGANDMAPGQSYSRTPQEWEDGLRAIVALRDQHAPNAGLLLLHGAAPANDPAGLDRVREYEARARAALEDAPRTSILYLSSLWQPRLDHTYTLMTSDPDGWLTDGVHMTAAAHSQVADLILGALASGMPATSGGTPSSVPWANVTGKPSSFTPTAHAATHATGGSDPITPASIGASPAGHGHAAAAITDLTETVQDIVGALIKAGTGTTVSYDDAAGTFTISATATGGSTDPEVVRDVIGSAMVAGSGIQITVDDAGDKITIASTAVLPTRKVNAGTGLSGGGDLSADRTLAVEYGTTAGTAAQGNDARLSDARTPTAHTHAAGDVTSGTFTPARLGTGTPSASTVLYGDGAWKDAPSGGGGGGEAHPLPGIRPLEWRHTLSVWDTGDIDLPYGYISAVPIWLDAGNYQTAFIQVRSGGGPSTLVRLGIYDRDENLVGDFGTGVANGESEVNISATVTVPTTGWHLAAAVAQGTDSPVQVQRGLPILGVVPGTGSDTRNSPGGRLYYTTRTYLGALPTSLAADSRQQRNWPISVAFRRSPA